MSPEVRDWWGVLAPDFGPSINTSIQQINRTSSAAVHPLLPPLIGHRQNNNYQSNYLINEFFPRFRFYRPTGYTHTHSRALIRTRPSHRHNWSRTSHAPPALYPAPRRTPLNMSHFPNVRTLHSICRYLLVSHPHKVDYLEKLWTKFQHSTSRGSGFIS